MYNSGTTTITIFGTRLQVSMGEKRFSVRDKQLGWIEGQWVKLFHDGYTIMEGTVVSYNNTTGSMVVNILNVLSNRPSASIISKQVGVPPFTTLNRIRVLTTSVAHGFSAGETVDIKNVDSYFDGTRKILSVPTATTFSLSPEGDLNNLAPVACTGVAKLSAASSYGDWTVSITCGYPRYDDSQMIRERKYLPRWSGYSSNPISNPEDPAVNAYYHSFVSGSRSAGILSKTYFKDATIDWKLLEDMGNNAVGTVTEGEVVDLTIRPYWNIVPNSYYYIDTTGTHTGLPPGLVASWCPNYFTSPAPGYTLVSGQTNPPYVWINGSFSSYGRYQIFFTYVVGGATNTFYVADVTVVQPQIVLTTASNTPPDGIKNVAYSHTFAVTNPDVNSIPLVNVVYSSSNFSIPGLTFNNGVISGIPTTPGAAYNFNLTITCDSGTLTSPKTIKIWPAPPKITSTSDITGATIGTAFSFQVVALETATSSIAVSYAATGLPTGLSINATNGLISGTPTGVGITVTCTATSTTNDFQATITASNTGKAGVQTDTQLVVVHLLDTRPPIVTDVALGTGSPITTNLGDIYRNLPIYYNQAIVPYQVEATNCPTQYVNIGLPTGLSISNLPSTPGIISGTPTIPGAYLLTVAARNRYTQGVAAITIIVGWPAPVINVDSNGVPTTLETEWVAGTTFTGSGQVVTATNSPTSFTLTNAPTGLSINSSGVLSGTVAPADAGSYNITISASNSGLFPTIPGYYPESAGTTNWSLTIYGSLTDVVPTIESFTLPDGTVAYINLFGYFTIEGVRGEQIGNITVQYEHNISSFTLAGQPSGVTINATTGTISGILTNLPTNLGTFIATYTATNNWGTVSVTIHFVIEFPAPIITSSTYSYGIIGQVFNPPYAYGGPLNPIDPPGYYITASYQDADVIISYNAAMPTLAYNSTTGFGLSIDTVTGLISGTIPPDVPPGVYPIEVIAINQGSHAAIPADSVGPGSAGVNIYVYNSAPEINAVSPNSASDLGSYSLIITGKNFVTGASVWFGNMSFVAGTEVVLDSSQSLTVTVPVLPVAESPYDVVVQNPDGQTATAKGALTITTGEAEQVSVSDQPHYTSLLNTQDSPIYSITNTNTSSLRKKRIFGLGTNVEVLFYSGLDVPGKKILNVYRKQNGTTSTRHGTGDVVFKGIASIQVSPFMYKATENGRISQINCLLRSNGKVNMSIKMFDGTTYEDEGDFFYTDYQAILVKELQLLPIPKIGTPDCG